MRLSCEWEKEEVSSVKIPKEFSGQRAEMEYAQHERQPRLSRVDSLVELLETWHQTQASEWGLAALPNQHEFQVRVVVVVVVVVRIHHQEHDHDLADSLDYGVDAVDLPPIHVDVLLVEFAMVLERSSEWRKQNQNPHSKPKKQHEQEEQEGQEGQ